MNNYAVSSDGIAVALQDSASALMAAGNDLEQAVALVAAANRVVQDPNSVGSALRTISLRLRGTSVKVLEEMGEETDGVVSSISKMQSKIEALTGVDILTESGAYKETYTILKEIGQVWEDMSDINQAALLELMAGKNRANTLAAILSNMKDLEGAYNDALKAEGSAIRENETHLDSIQGRIELFTNSLQTMWMNFLDTDLVKFFVDLGRILIEITDNIGVLPIAITAVGAYITRNNKMFSSANGEILIFNKNIDDIRNNFNQLSQDADGAFGTIKAAWNAIFSSDTKKIDLSNMLTESDFDAKLNGMITGFQNMGVEINKVNWDKYVDGITASDAAMGAALKTCTIQNETIQAGSNAYQAYTGSTAAAAAGTAAVGTAAQTTKVAMVGAKVAALGLQAALTMGIGVLISLATTAISKWINAAEEARKAAKDAVDASEAIRQQADSLKDYKDQIIELRAELDKNNISEADAYDARKQLLSIQEELINKFGLERDGINLVTGAINDQISAIDKLSQQDASKWVTNNQKSINDAIKFFEDSDRGSRLDPWYELNANGSSIINYAPTQRVHDLVKEYAKGNSHVNVDGGTLSQHIGFVGSVEEVKSEVEDFQKWLATKEKEIQSEIDAIDPTMDTRALGSNLSNLQKDLEQIQDMREDIGEEYKNWFGDDSTYATNKALIEQLQYNKAITDYADQYTAIIKAQNDLNDAIVKGDADQEKAARDVLEEAFSAANAASKGEWYMKEFFEGIQKGYYESDFEFELKTDDRMQEHIAKIIQRGGEDGLASLYDIDINEMIKNGLNLDGATHDGTRFTKQQVSALQALQEEADNAQIPLESLISILIKLGYIKGQPQKATDSIEASGQAYSMLAANAEKYAEVQSILNEATYDNVEITKEQYEALQEAIGAEEGFSKCIDTSNGYIVTNTQLLNKLLKSAKANTAQNTKLAKSQAILDYYGLYKQIKTLSNSNRDLAKTNAVQIQLLYDQMTALQKTIAKYSLLEQELLGATNAYEKFAEAQEIDSQTDYISSAEEMLSALGEAFNTAELGSESAQAAIMGLVPESVYESLDTVDEKIAAIYDYFKNGKLSQYFDITFDEDGNIESAEMKLGNLRKFIEDGLLDDGANVFDGSDWMHFQLSDAFMAQLDDLPAGADKLKVFADAMGVTKEVALAFLKTLEDHDVEWLGGDYTTLLDQFGGLESKIYNTTSELARLELQLAKGAFEGEDGIREYAAKYKELTGNMAEFKQQARDNIVEYQSLTNQIDEQKAKIDQYTKAIKQMQDAGKSDEEIKLTADYQSLIDASKVYSDLVQKRTLLSQPTEIMIELASENLDQDIEDIRTKLQQSLGKAITFGEDGTYTISAEIKALSETDRALIEEYQKLWETKHAIEVETDPEQTKTALQEIEDSAQSALDVIDSIDGTTITINTSSAVSNVDKLRSALEKLAGVETVKVDVQKPSLGSSFNSPTFSKNSSLVEKHFAAWADGTQSAPHSEEALVGELGPEMLVRNGRWHTVGERGAEFTQVKRGDIIFNHKQTEQLLKNGRVASRGRAFAEGTAYAGNVTIWPYGSSQSQWDGTGYSSWDDPTYDLNEALDSAAGSVEDFEEVIDWIEIRMEELSEKLSLYSAKLENNLNYFDKNSTINTMIDVNKAIIENARAGAAYYERHANQYLSGMSDVLIEAAKNGAISIQEFTKTEDEATVNAIQKYREFIQKAADLTQQVEETITEIRNLELQQIANAQHSGDVRANIEDMQTSKLQSAVDYDEARGLITDPAYYAAMMENSERTIDYLTTARSAMQKEFDDALAKGLFTNSDGSYNDLFYEELEKLYDVDAQIDEAVASLEEFQNAINDIYWEGFDELINRFDYISEETQGLIDLMSELDMVSKPDNNNGWGADDVEWTKEGLASLGLHAQEMERAEEKAKAYSIAIDDLTAEYQAGHYSESEYHEKLNELTQGQYDAIKAAREEKEAIVDLQKSRIDAIKEGIEKEIEAYEELIDKKKEELSAEKDLYDFQKGVQNQQKDIAAIQRKLAALSADNSASAVAQRKKLEAELTEANAALEETYYDRSVENKQNALDQELEDFKTEKEAEIEQWEQWLENIEAVVTESLGIVQANAAEIGQTLTEKATEYNLTVSDAVLNPWKDGALAIDDYTTKFGDSVSSTTEQLETIRSKWQEIKEELAAANAVADEYFAKAKENHSLDNPSVADINKENANYAAANKTSTSTPTVNTNTNNNTNANQNKGTPAVGGSVKVKSTATHYGSKSGNAQMASFVPGGAYTAYKVDGDQVLIGLNGAYTGWVNLKDLEGYASGTTSLKKSGLITVDELGEELILGAHNGRLTYAEKGTGIIPADITSNLMAWGELNPQDMLDRNRPSITPSKSIVNTEINIDNSIGELIHIDKCSTETIPDIEKIVNNALDKHTQKLNQSLRKFTR